MKPVRNCLIVLSLLALMVSLSGADDKCDAVYGNGKNRFSLATGSPGELGILMIIAEAFAKENNAKMCWVKAGSGESIQLLRDKKVDMIMVHAPAAEKRAVADGWATNHKLIGSNEFYIVGPANDPAKIGSAKNVADAYKRIADSRSKFFSRGDNSGTHKKEMDAWAKAGINPSGDWYIITRAFMTETLKRADTEKGYFMTDSSTWVAERTNMPNLKILFRGDKFLINTYHTLSQPEGVTAGAGTAAKFIEFVVSKKGQKMLSDYGKNKFGEGLYNDAAYAKQYDN
jgi:tungstate transport system substrate-binding protein